MSGNLLSGRVMFNPFDEAGLPTGFVKFGNTTSLVYKREDGEKKTRISKDIATYGQVIEEVILPGTTSLSMKGDGFDRDALAMLFMGDSTDKVVVAGSVAAESKDLIENKWVRLNNRNITTGTVVITGKVEGTDFKVDYKSGLILALNSGMAVTQSIAYDHGGYTGFEIKGNTRNNIHGELLLIGKNMTDQHRVDFNVLDVTLTPSGDYDFLSSDFAEMNLSGSMKIPDGLDYPYIYTDYGVI